MIIRDLWKYYGGLVVLQDITATVGPQDRLGLVGANGVGKTTLLRILAGEESMDRGQISCHRDYSRGYLTQTIEFRPKTLQEYLEEPFADQIRIIAAMREQEKELATLTEPDHLKKSMADYSRLHDRFEHGGSYDYLVQIREVATGLGFSEDDLKRSLSTFSGGERMRVSLGRLLLTRPSLLLLDEPTNHLDLEGIHWLEGFLSTYPHAFIVVSHDRYFLDKTVTRIWEIHNHRLYQYRGNYSQYLPQRSQLQEQLEDQRGKQEQEKKQIEAFVRKFGAGTRARQAKSLQKRLRRFEEVQTFSEDPRLAFRFEPRRSSGNNVVFLEDIRKAYGQNEVLRGITADIKRGQRIALLGPNGSGKSTLLKILSGELEFGGGIRWGTGVEPAYFSQEISFTKGNTVLEELYAEHRLDFGILRSVLGRFLFSGEDVLKKTEVLSGGERNRLAMACLLLHRPNFLILDEPTNHLDIFAREALEKALEDFGGTILFVSHDRYFIDKIANRIWLLDQGRLRDYRGDFRYYQEIRSREVSQASVVPDNRERQVRRAASFSPVQLEKQREAAEKEIARLEERKAELEEKLASPQLYQDEAKSVPVVREYREIEIELHQRYETWENLVDKLQKGE